MAFDKKLLLTTTVIAGLAVFAPTLAVAQTQPPAAQQPEPLQDPEDEVTEVDEIVVTGSRIRRDSYTATQPIEVITADEARLEGLVDAAEILQSSTAAGTATQINNNFTGFLTTGGPGVNTLSIRGLGAQRTLVLLNGRRLGPAGARGTVGPVDLNVIPGSLVERYELLLDGASSIYGSDALAGVVNILTPTTIDGGYMEAFASQPFESGGEEYTLSGRFGRVFDRGYASVGAEFYERQELLAKDRDIFCSQDFVFRDENLNIRADTIDPATGDFKCNERIQNMVRTFRVFATPQGPIRTGDFQPDPSARYGGGFRGCDINGWRQVGGAAAPCNINTLPTADRRAAFAGRTLSSDRDLNVTVVSPARRYSLAGFAGFDLTPNTEVFTELLWNRRESEQIGVRQIFPEVSPFHTQNPFGGPCNGTTTAGGPTDCHSALSIPAVNFGSRQEIDYMRAVLGVRGEFNLLGRSWGWEVAGQYSRSDATYESDQFYNDRVEATAGSLAFRGRDLNGNVVPVRPFGVQAGGVNCDRAILISASDCPAGGVNWFDPGLLATGSAPGFDDFLQFVSVGTTEYTQKYVEGVISGELFDLPAGSVGAALGFHIREDEIDDNPDAEEQRRNLWGFSAAGRTRGTDSVREVFGEVELPLLADRPFFNEFTLNLSGRLSDYDSYGENSTYKVGLNWRITPEFRIRASQGTSFRAPALYELFLADQTGFAGQLADPCINYQNSTNTTLQQNCAADGIPEGYAGAGPSIQVTTGGGADILEAEDGENFTVGLIYTPDFIDLNFAVDYFETTISNQVAQIGTGNILFGCYTSETFPEDGLCDLFVRDRDPASSTFLNILTLDNSFVNISEQKQTGLDFTVRYNREFSFGDLGLTLRASHILDFTTQTFAAFPPTNANDFIGNPETVGNAQVRFNRGDWTVFYDVNYVGPADNLRFFAAGNAIANYFGEPVFAQRSVDEYFLHSASVRREIDDWSFLVGVRNLFDENPPQITGGVLGNSPLTSQYDTVGRRLFVSIAKEF